MTTPPNGLSRTVAEEAYEAAGNIIHDRANHYGLGRDHDKYVVRFLKELLKVVQEDLDAYSSSE